ncbi:TPA: hypothetical protein HA241_00255 [Candidatus Woesearchaeota archaeon]|nr:hypothetical protein [Candidatus Woesearchaeota archaeon]
MATVLDIGGLFQAFDFVFPFLFVTVLVLAVLQKTKAISESAAINGILGVICGFMIILSRTLIDLINFMIPWFTVAIVFIVLMFLIFSLFGAKEANFLEALKANDKTVIWVIVGVGIVILVAGLGKVLGQNIGPYLANETGITDGSGVATGSFEQNVTATLFHPKVLGLLVLFGIAIFAVLLLTS